MRLDAITATLSSDDPGRSGHDRWAENGAMGDAAHPAPPPVPNRAPRVIAPCRRPRCFFMEHSSGDHHGFCCGRCRDPYRDGHGPQCEAVARNPLPAAETVVPAAPVAAIPMLGTDAPVAAAADPVVPAEGPPGHVVVDPVGFNPYDED